MIQTSNHIIYFCGQIRRMGLLARETTLSDMSVFLIREATLKSKNLLPFRWGLVNRKANGSEALWPDFRQNFLYYLEQNISTRISLIGRQLSCVTWNAVIQCVIRAANIRAHVHGMSLCSLFKAVTVLGVIYDQPKEPKVVDQNIQIHWLCYGLSQIFILVSQDMTKV